MSAKYFIKLIETARSKGIMGESQMRNLTEQEWSLIEKCRPFVACYEQPLNQWVPLEEQYKEKEVDAPFPVFSIESNIPVGALTEPRTGIVVPIWCAVICELRPKEYVGYSLEEIGDTFGVFYLSPAKAATLAHVFCKTIPQSKMGREIVRTSVKISSGNHKRNHRIREVIHIMPRTVFKINPPKERNIDWSHRFEVRGHWRKIETVGKDREGNYCVEGFTWVKHHARGPEHLPLIKKERLIYAGLDMTQLTKANSAQQRQNNES